MKFEDYQEKALETALETALTEGYLVPGLIAELGEVLSLFAKNTRDGGDLDLDALAKEIGDCYWFIAVCGEHFDHYLSFDTIGDIYQSEDKFDSTTPQVAVYAMIYGAVEEAAKFNEFSDDLLRGILEGLSILEYKFGLDRDNVLQMNLDKLASRKERGVLGGSGDNR